MFSYFCTAFSRRKRINERTENNKTFENMKVAIIMGSTSDLEIMSQAINVLEGFGVEVVKRVISAHRTPDLMCEFAKSAKAEGIGVIIAGAGGAAHVAGVVAGMTTVPAIIHDCSDDEAAIAMVDLNIQRKNISHSEKAKAYKIKYDAMKHQGVKGNSLKAMSDETGENAKKIQLTTGDKCITVKYPKAALSVACIRIYTEKK